MIQISHKKELENLLTKHELELFSRLKELIQKLNKISNLTRLIDGNDYWVSQVYDSIWPFFKDSNKLFENKKFIDIGSGCGFPGLAYAITHPTSEIYLIDSSLKKTNALKQIVESMNLKNKIHIINDRIENIGHDLEFRHKFDIGTARAVSSAPTVSHKILILIHLSLIRVKDIRKRLVVCLQLLQCQYRIYVEILNYGLSFQCDH